MILNFVICQVSKIPSKLAGDNVIWKPIRQNNSKGQKIILLKQLLGRISLLILTFTIFGTTTISHSRIISIQLKEVSKQILFVASHSGIPLVDDSGVRFKYSQANHNAVRSAALVKGH
jgi:hypothetical protein